MRRPSLRQLTLSCLFLVLAAQGCGPAPAPPPGPAAAFPETRHDFGTAIQGERLAHAFTVENRGSEELTLALEAPETLTVDGFDPVVAPGEQGSIRLSFDTTGLAGSGELAAEVVTNDPKLPRQTLVLSGRVVPLIDIQPKNRVYFFDLPAGQGAEGEVTLVNHQDQPLAVREVRTPEAGVFRATLETVEAGQRYRLRVTLPPEVTPGRWQETFTLVTDSPQLPEIPIHVRATVVDRVYARPAAVHFGTLLYDDLDQELLAERPVLVRASQGRPLEVRGVTSDLPFLEFEVRREGPDRQQILVRIDPEKARRGEFGGTLVVETGDPELPRLEIPVSGNLV